MKVPGTPDGPPLTLRGVRAVKKGDMLDLSGDPYADPNSRNRRLCDAYVEVLDVEQDGPASVKIRWAGGELRFPIEHEVLAVADD